MERSRTTRKETKLTLASKIIKRLKRRLRHYLHGRSPQTLLGRRLPVLLLQDHLLPRPELMGDLPPLQALRRLLVDDRTTLVHLPRRGQRRLWLAVCPLDPKVRSRHIEIFTVALKLNVPRHGMNIDRKMGLKWTGHRSLHVKP